MNLNKNACPTQSLTPAIAPIDAAPPTVWETATFGLG
jgi:hypothetical protein